MRRIAIPVIKCRSLGYEVYRGYVQTKELYPSLWIDRYDEVYNPEGYQRAFNEKRSEEAAKYAAEEPRGFWPECILSIRAEEKDGHRESVVQWAFQPINPNTPNFGNLVVDYDENKVKDFGGNHRPWYRAFSQVDCQHRLGRMNLTDKLVTVCIFPDLLRVEEAILFKVINEKHKGIDTSLVDQIIFKLSKGKLFEPTLHWARQLANEPSSPFYQKVDTGGENLQKRLFVVRLRTLHECVSLVFGEERSKKDSFTKTAIVNLDLTETDRTKNYDKMYEFLRNFWSVVRDVWPEEWEITDKKYKKFKLITTPGLKGLSMVARKVFEKAVARDDYSYDYCKQTLNPAVGYIDWSNNGDFKDATGNAGANTVRDKLLKRILPGAGISL